MDSNENQMYILQEHQTLLILFLILYACCATHPLMSIMRIGFVAWLYIHYMHDQTQLSPYCNAMCQEGCQQKSTLLFVFDCQETCRALCETVKRFG